MTILTPIQCADAWVSNGGPKNRVVAWVSVAVAESSLDTEAVSPTDARGLWQIEPYSWPEVAGPISNWDNPGFNALAAVTLSGGGANFAPWDTAYANIYSSGRYSFLNWPEVGSAAYNNMGWVAAKIAGVPFTGTTAPSEPGLDGSLPAAIAFYQQVSASATPALADRLHRIMARTNRQYTKRLPPWTFCALRCIGQAWRGT